jgi:5,10-methylene-tetrahydrofolate dehydrogenase/methenyl tetrahydrofolate cyclohydrolase
MNVKVVFDNKMTKVFENDKLIFQGFDSKSRAFGLNVVDQSHNPDSKHWVRWREKTCKDEGHKKVFYLVA